MLDLEFDAFCETIRRYFHCDASKEHYQRAFVFFTAAKGRGMPITDEDLQWAMGELSSQGKFNATSVNTEDL